MASIGHDSDARQVLEHFTASMDGARDKLNKEEQRLATAAQEGAVLKRSVRVLAEQRGALTAALATLEAETARLDQHAERRRAHYAAVDGALEAIQSKKRAADGELQSTVDRVAAARAAFVRRGLEVQGALLGMLDEYSPDTVRAAVSARRQELAMRIFSAIDGLPPGERAGAFRSLAARAGADAGAYLAQFRYMNSAEIVDARRRGLRFGLHTHRHRAVTRHLAEMACEIDENRSALQQHGAGADFTHFCYPGGYYQPEVEPILAKLGIVSATLTRRGLNAPGAHPFRLRRLLDGPRVSQIAFEAYLAGVFEPIDRRQS